MGIPSFYRRLSIGHKGLIGKDRGQKTAALYFDFNCLIYTVVRSPAMPPYSASSHKEWEAILYNEICKYILLVWTYAGSPSEVFLSIDGVVPLAKIKQQRLRRFKSAWLVKEELSRGIRTPGDSWDTNAITPGTAFMDGLGQKLQDFCKQRGKGWSVSTASEPGEGEQKIMQRLRNRTPESFDGSLLIYGLDADLILLTLLNGVGKGFQHCYLMREDKEMGKPELQNEFSFFSMNKLPELLWRDFASLSFDQKLSRIQNYVCGMSLLGNDFLPHSLSIHVRDDGHEILSRDLVSFEKEGKALLQKGDDGLLTLNQECLRELLSNWSQQEENTILQMIRKKQSFKHQTNQVDAEQVLQALPLEWDVEREVVLYKKNDEGKYRIEFLPRWKQVYHEKWLKGHSIQDLTRHYVYGVQWVFDYYTGQRPIPNTWMYPCSLPPLWSELISHLPLNANDTTIAYQEIQPQQQLSMVLPLSSWYLIRDKKYRSLPFDYPQYFPRLFSFYSVGKRHLWECEPDICHLPLFLIA
jgi:5'-3' exoribonuclease 2